ncbi:nucleoside-diphosphate sugar epimerase [Pedobacter psychrophilus]|uniref:Nucleoside-diphosphate sugar epimerase n=1 Tax=Pedobacter psychrophilus TaxID=1826909 RepID=A0A179DBM8_9SPHI|nr:NAD-dependent epimerase/dehydratase family protein [Pedobacter psychrophilus]OAQ38455.1 nucleoside-diphosphate sugar epimerase [Pedobacter psychrophilus]
MILITGATGFLGTELAFQLLQTETKIRCAKREHSKIPLKLNPYANNIEWVNADILDLSDLAEAFKDVTKVFHCAALVSFETDLKKKMLAVNAEGTANVVNLCIENNIEKLVHVSSIAAIGEAKGDELITEKNFWEGFENHDGYAVSKYRGEMEVWRGINEGLNAVIVNPSVIIGEDAGKEGSGAIFETIRNGFKYYTQGGTGFVDVKDVAKTMILLMTGDIVNERFILNSENISYKDLFAKTAQIFGLPIPEKEAKPWMLNMAWRLTALKNWITKSKGGLNKATANNASKMSAYSNDKIKSALNFDFIPLQESITKIANSLKSA